MISKLFNPTAALSPGAVSGDDHQWLQRVGCRHVRRGPLQAQPGHRPEPRWPSPGGRWRLVVQGGACRDWLVRRCLKCVNHMVNYGQLCSKIRSTRVNYGELWSTMVHCAESAEAWGTKSCWISGNDQQTNCQFVSVDQQINKVAMSSMNW